MSVRTLKNSETLGSTPYAPHDATEMVVQSSTQLATQVPKGLTRTEAIEQGRDAWQKLRLGTLVTKKAVQTSKAIRYTVAGSNIGVAAQTIPDYNGLSANIGDNNAYIADQAIMWSVTHAYNLTADPGRATDLFTAASFTVDISGLTLTAGPSASDIIEVQGSYLPYQGCFANTPLLIGSTATSHVLYEWLETLAVVATTDGTGNSVHDTNSYLDMPLIPKLPMPESTNLRNTSFGGGGLSYLGAAVGSSQSPRTRENVPIQIIRNVSGFGALYPGVTFYLTSATPVTTGRGARQTFPQFIHSMPTFVTVQATYMTVLVGLVRVADLQQDNAYMVPGRLMLMVACTQNTGSVNPPGLGTQVSISATDVFRLPNDPDYFEGMVVAA